MRYLKLALGAPYLRVCLAWASVCGLIYVCTATRHVSPGQDPSGLLPLILCITQLRGSVVFLRIMQPIVHYAMVSYKMTEWQILDVCFKRASPVSPVIRCTSQTSPLVSPLGYVVVAGYDRGVLNHYMNWIPLTTPQFPLFYLSLSFTFKSHHIN